MSETKNELLRKYCETKIEKIQRDSFYLFDDIQRLHQSFRNGTVNSIEHYRRLRMINDRLNENSKSYQTYQDIINMY